MFITARLRDGRSERLTNHVAALRGAIEEVATARPFKQEALVVLHDHFHAIWTMPSGDRSCGLRVSMVQALMSRGWAHHGALWLRKVEQKQLDSLVVVDWHVSLCVNDPVKHGLASRAMDWPHTFLDPDVAIRHFDRVNQTDLSA